MTPEQKRRLEQLHELTPQPSVAPIARTLSDAPTVITFFAI